MRPHETFANIPSFSAIVRAITIDLGYSSDGRVVVPDKADILKSLSRNDFGHGTELVTSLVEYFRIRAHDVETEMIAHMMSVEEAAYHFNELRARYNPKCPLPHNSQQDREPRYLTGIINILLETCLSECDFNPQRCVSFRRKGLILGTLSRRVDGAYPSCINPIAFWEVKEFYANKTFGSRCASALYDTLLDGEELRALKSSGVKSKHYLFLDAMPLPAGISYLCRLYDALHTGMVDGIFCGRQVLRLVPELAREWKAI